MADQTKDVVYFCPPENATTIAAVGGGVYPVCRTGGYYAVVEQSTVASYWNTEVKGGQKLISSMVLCLVVAFLWKIFARGIT